MGRSPGQKISNETLDLNYTLDQVDLIDMYKRIHQTSAEYIFFSSAPGVFSRIECMFKDKISQSKCKIEITPSIFPTTMV